MSQNKTTENENSVPDFLQSVTDAQQRQDSEKLVEIFSAQTGFKAKMWGTAIIGFGSYHYKYDSGREGDAPLAGFSPRKGKIALYFSSKYDGREALMAKLGKHQTAKACVYVKKLSDIDTDILKKMIAASVKHMQSIYPS
ncbi:YdhG-like domain-containing protein [Flavobacterium longum]|uniref:DUF1801 domain-containing protein n=1 Tax=Flavobacterium longum TaxID=1299340 RepID=UPI0039ED258E